MPLFLLLVAVPIIEIALFIEVGGRIGLWPTIAVVILTAAIGTGLLRAQGLATLGELQHRLRIGANPAPTLAHGAMILVAGLLLLTPGFFTDAIGLVLLVRPVRAAAIRYAAARITVVTAGTAERDPRGAPTPEPATVEGEYDVVEPDNAGDRRGAGGLGAGEMALRARRLRKRL